MASASAVLFHSLGSVFFAFLRCWSRPNPHCSYSSHVTSHLPIQNGSSLTSTCGPSSVLRSFSPAGLPILNVPPGIGTMSNFTSVLRIFSVYGFMPA